MVMSKWWSGRLLALWKENLSWPAHYAKMEEQHSKNIMAQFEVRYRTSGPPGPFLEVQFERKKREKSFNKILEEELNGGWQK